MPKRFDRDLEMLETTLEAVKEHSNFEAIAKEYHRLLDILGNVDGDEAIALAMIATANVNGVKYIKEA